MGREARVEGSSSTFAVIGIETNEKVSCQSSFKVYTLFLKQTISVDILGGLTGHPGDRRAPISWVS